MIQIIKPTPKDKQVKWDKKRDVLSKTDKFGNIEYVNDGYCDLSGYDDFELVSQSHNVVRHPDMPKAIFKMIWENLNAGHNFMAILKNISKSGKYFWLLTEFEIVYDDDDEIVNYIAHHKAVPEDALKKHIIPLYNKLLHIEETNSVEASEKYLVGFLEEKDLSYIDWINDCLGNRGFFARLFG